MNPLPTEIQQRLDGLAGARVALVYEPMARPRAVLVFERPGHDQLTVTVDNVSDAAWGFATAPTVRVPWRYDGVVRAVRLATVRSFAPGAAPDARTVRVEVDIEGVASVALEGDGLSIGPLPGPPPRPATPAAS